MAGPGTKSSNMGVCEVTFEEFCDLVAKVLDSIPSEIIGDISVNAEDYPTKGSIEIMQRSKMVNIYGFWNPMIPNNITLCYWGFRADNDFSEQRISNVIKHEIEHSLTGPLGLKHSEHL